MRVDIPPLIVHARSEESCSCSLHEARCRGLDHLCQGLQSVERSGEVREGTVECLLGWKSVGIPASGSKVEVQTAPASHVTKNHEMFFPWPCTVSFLSLA